MGGHCHAQVEVHSCRPASQSILTSPGKEKVPPSAVQERKSSHPLGSVAVVVKVMVLPDGAQISVEAGRLAGSGLGDSVMLTSWGAAAAGVGIVAGGAIVGRGQPGFMVTLPSCDKSPGSNVMAPLAAMLTVQHGPAVWAKK